MATYFDDPRYGVSISLKKTNTNDSVSRNYSYVNLKIGGASSGYGPDDIYEFAQMVESLSGGIVNTVALNGVNVTAQIPVLPE